MAKLMCYSWEGFGRELECKGWRDGNLPEDWVFVSIGEYEPCLEKPHILRECEQVINLNFDDICGYRMWDTLPNEEWTEEKKMFYSNVHGISCEIAETAGMIDMDGNGALYDNSDPVANDGTQSEGGESNVE